jgi:hypothetical protein
MGAADDSQTAMSLDIFELRTYAADPADTRYLLARCRGVLLSDINLELFRHGI